MRKFSKLVTTCLSVTMIFVATVSLSGCQSQEDKDKKVAQEVADKIDKIYVAEFNKDTYKDCKDAKASWDKLTKAQKKLVKGENADEDYFGRDTGDAKKDNPLNQDNIGEKEIMVVSFGTSFNDSRVSDISSIEKAVQAAYPDWSVRRAFTSQIIMNHIYARDGEKIDNVDQALNRAVKNKVKTIIVQPTHLMQGKEYDELVKTVKSYEKKFDSIKVALPLLGEVGQTGTTTNSDKTAVAKAITNAAAQGAGFASTAQAAQNSTAFVLMGHGTSHNAKITYTQMQTEMKNLGLNNVFVGTVEGEPEETSCKNIIKAVKAAGYKNVILRPMMVVAGDHANNDMAGDDDDSWKTMFEKSGNFDSVKSEIKGLGQIPEIEKIYIAHIAAAMNN